MVREDTNHGGDRFLGLVVREDTNHGGDDLLVVREDTNHGGEPLIFTSCTDVFLVHLSALRAFVCRCFWLLFFYTKIRSRRSYTKGSACFDSASTARVWWFVKTRTIAEMLRQAQHDSA